MPTHVKYEYWLCDLCESKHKTLKAAEECEKQGIILPKFMNKEIVEVLNGRLGIVSWVMMDNLVHSVHKPIFEYEVKVSRDVTKFSGNKMIVFKENEINKSIYPGTDCPLCGNKGLMQRGGIDTRPFFGSSAGDFISFSALIFGSMSNMSPFMCLRCHEEFYSYEQRNTIEQYIRANLKSLLATS